MAPAEALYPAARRAKAEAVTRSVRLAGTYDADQSGILDAYRQRDADLEAYAQAFAWKEGQAGVICGIGGAIACADLFDHREALRRLYPRLVRSYALDALGIDKGEADSTTSRRFVETAARAAMTVHRAVGLGDEVRLTGEGVTGSALVADERVVHLALFPATPARDAEPTVHRRAGVGSTRPGSRLRRPRPTPEVR